MECYTESSVVYFFVFTYRVVVVTVELFHSEPISALQSLGRLREPITKEIDRVTSRADAEQIENQVENIGAGVAELKERNDFNYIKGKTQFFLIGQTTNIVSMGV